ncbi:hypothetical protein DFH06DRAFT_1326588 [Mycena polygramma]|nr:hypothetical protein DFH06DRAFT_1326588 [Mycena polygramma]
MLRLPGELVDFIIDLLSSDASALATCSLLSRQWLPRSQHRRFSTLSLIIGCDSEDKRVQQLLSIVASPVATFAPFVQEVKLTHKRKRSEGAATSCREILSSLHGCGIRPTRLYRNCHRHFTIPLDGPPAFTSSLVHLDLAFDDWAYVALASIIDYICAFPLLESLKVAGLTGDAKPTVPTSAGLPPRLHTLYAGNPLITEWITSLNPVPKHITTVCFLDFIEFPNLWSAINKYLRSPAGATINSITLSFADFQRLLYFGAPDFQSVPHLRHLTLRTGQYNAVLCVLPVLSALRLSPSRNTLETITIVLYLRYVPETWIALDAELADAERYPHLRRITLSTIDSGERFLADLGYGLGLGEQGKEKSALAGAVRKHLPRCEERGILDVHIPLIVP